ncbi:MAG TPA: metallopeptidase family protein [Mycobacteriales bacterium]|nr:metallopeptidase family protein [Mycobacteriales bacterium]
MTTPGSTAASRRRRDRRGRGLRGRLVPPHVPLSQTKAEQFDELVLDALEHLEARWAEEIAKLEFAVEDVPPPETVDGGVIPLSRLLPAVTHADGVEQPARLVVYRRPVEARALDRADLADLVLDVVVTELARHLGLDPDVVDPPGG